MFPKALNICFTFVKNGYLSWKRREWISAVFRTNSRTWAELGPLTCLGYRFLCLPQHIRWKRMKATVPTIQEAEGQLSWSEARWSYTEANTLSTGTGWKLLRTATPLALLAVGSWVPGLKEIWIWPNSALPSLCLFAAFLFGSSARRPWLAERSCWQYSLPTYPGDQPVDGDAANTRAFLPTEEDFGWQNVLLLVLISR